MSGVTDMVLYACWNCPATWLADDQMYEDPARCPHCGMYPDQRPGNVAHGGGSNVDAATWQGEDAVFQGEKVTW